MRQKYYMLKAGKKVRLLNLEAWRQWIANTPYTERLLAYTMVDNLSVDTMFDGAVNMHHGPYTTYVSGASSKLRMVRHYWDAQAALAGHLAVVDEIRANHERLVQNNQQRHKQVAEILEEDGLDGGAPREQALESDE